MSLVSSIQGSLGIHPHTPAAHSVTSELARKGGIIGGAAASGYVNGRFASPGKDYLEISLPSFMGGQKVPLDATYAIVVNLLAMFDMVPFGLDEIGMNTADGVLGQVIGRMATKKGSEHLLAAATHTPEMTAKASGPSNVRDFRPRAAQKFDMHG